MTITSIRLRNFRKFEEYETKLNEHLTVLAGSHDSGRTTILDALSIAAGTFLLGLDGVRSPSIAREDARILCKDPGGRIGMQPQFPVEIAAEGVLYGQKIQWTRKRSSREGGTTRKNAGEMLSLAASCRERIMNGDASLILPAVVLYGEGRVWTGKIRQNTATRRSQRQNGYLRCLDGEADEALMLRWFEKMTIQTFERGGMSDSYRSVRDAVIRCLEVLTGLSGIDVFYDLDSAELIVTAAGPSGTGERFPMHVLDSGVRNTVGLVSDLAYRTAVLNPQLPDPVKETPGIALVDGIERDLDPERQKAILPMLHEIFPKIQ